MSTTAVQAHSGVISSSTSSTTTGADAAAVPSRVGDSSADFTIHEWALTVTATSFALAFLFLATRKFRRNGGKVWWIHVLYWCGFAAFVVLIPDRIEFVLFSRVAVMVIGTVYPIYESLRALCTAIEEDDKSWLQFWIAQAVVCFATAWLDDYHVAHGSFPFRWRQFEAVYFTWLLLPFTDGASLTFEYFTKPYVAPLVEPLASKANNFIQALSKMTVNVMHLAVAWIFFVILPSVLKRFLVILTGVSYPMMASIVAVTTERDDDDVFWLMYWSSYGILFLIMDFLEDYIGWIWGFYSVFLLCTVYLMLPMFQGAEKLFRHVLVPIAGLRNLLLRGDALRVKKEMFKTLPPEQIAVLRKEIAKSFAEDDSDLPQYLQRRVNGGGGGSSGDTGGSSSSSTRPSTTGGGEYGALDTKESGAGGNIV